jgi:WhiB family transcriptional regulator, redox-sensing transcriptional regulator
VTSRDDWQTQSLCRGNHAHLFFPPSTFERKEERERRELRAKAICRVCPVIEACREHSLTIREQFGIWGGLTELERREVIISVMAG